MTAQEEVRIPPTLPPPPGTIGPAAWARKNLFSTWYNGIVTLVMAIIVAAITVALVRWAVLDARWGVVTENLRLFLVGQYPPDQIWRPWLSLTVLSVLSGLSAARFGTAVRTLALWLAAGQVLLAGLAAVGDLGPAAVAGLLLNAVIVWTCYGMALRWQVPRRLLVFGWLASFPITFVLLSGVSPTVLPTVSTNLWGGLLLTILIAVVGIVLSFPFGVLLALGRRSPLPAISFLSTAYIELIRGVPLVTVLFIADIMLPLFLPGEVRIDRVARAMGGVTLFSAAYVAENVRGGLQAIPSGQLEAAQAIGLNTVQTNRFIVLPQALRAVIPANVGLFISLLKDTTLVTIVGLLELLGIGRAVLAQPEWLGTQVEVYVFIAVVFFVLCYTMSQASYRLEAALGVGTR